MKSLVTARAVQAGALVVLGAAMVLAGCGGPLTTREKGALTGAALGAGAGAIVGEATGAGAGKGARFSFCL